MSIPINKKQATFVFCSLISTSFLFSCTKPSPEEALHSAILFCRSGMDKSQSISDIKSNVENKGFGEISYGESPKSIQTLIDQVRDGSIGGRRVEQNSPLAFVLASKTTPSFYVAWIDLDTTGNTLTHGNSKACLVGPLQDEQVGTGLQQIVDYASANGLLSKIDADHFAVSKAKPHDILRGIQTKKSGNLLGSNADAYTVTSNSGFLAFYNDAMFGGSN